MKYIINNNLYLIYNIIVLIIKIIKKLHGGVYVTILN